MKISSRLLLALLPIVVGIMALYAVWAVRQREALLLEQSEADARVFSSVVSVAFAQALRDLQAQDAQEILTEVDDEPGIYGVVFYDLEGIPTIRSESIQPEDLAPKDVVDSVLGGESPVVFERLVDGERVQSVLRTVRARDGTVRGALEVVQPLVFLEGYRVQTASRFLLNTVTLLVVLAILLTWLVRRYVERPLAGFVVAIRGLGEGEILPRLDEGPQGSELAEVAREFNRMVSRLAAAMDEVERETEERLTLEERMREQRHLAALGTLAAGVAHQMGTPLSVIGGRADVLLGRHQLTAEDARSLEVIREQANRIARIVRNLLLFASRPEPDNRPTEAAFVVNRALELLAPDLQDAGIRVQRVFEDAAWVEADPELLEEVLLTVLENAFQALREPGADPTLLIRIVASPEETVIEVWDGGPGMPDDVVPKVFEPFFTTRSGGTGLGLPVAREIMEQLGGTLDVANALPAEGAGPAPSAPDADRSPSGVVVRIGLRTSRHVPDQDILGPTRMATP